MTLTTYAELVQGSQEWLDARRGIVTASVVGQLITKEQPPAIEFYCTECHAEAGNPCVSKTRKEPTPVKTMHPARVASTASQPPRLAVSRDDKARGLTMTLAAERITGRVEETFRSAAMWRGVEEEPLARDAYSTHHVTATEIGFMVREFDGCQVGYSPDGIVGDDGLIEIKSRDPKKHIRTVLADTVPAENMAQLQCGLYVSGRKWIDYVSYCSGMALWVKRVYPEPEWEDTIRAAASELERRITDIQNAYIVATIGLPVMDITPDYDEMRVA